MTQTVHSGASSRHHEGNAIFSILTINRTHDLFQLFSLTAPLLLLTPVLCSPLVPGLDLGLGLGPLGNVLQDMADAGGDMAAGMEMADMAAGGADAGAMMAAMTPAMSMSFLLPGIGLGLLKGMLFGKDLFEATFH